MKIGIIGAGAMGSLLAFYLSQHAEVWLLDGWQAQVQAINDAGLRCELDGVEATRRPHASSDAAKIGACDMVLILVKAHQTIWAAQQADLLIRHENRGRRAKQEASPLSPQSLGLKTLVVTLQNGVGTRELLEQAL